MLKVEDVDGLEIRDSGREPRQALTVIHGDVINPRR